MLVLFWKHCQATNESKIRGETLQSPGDILSRNKSWDMTIIHLLH